jgi:PPOX class probable F420-dependent enzyme
VRLAAEDVVRLATVTPEGAPHIVPVCFTVDGDVVSFAIDDKPKSSPDLRRLANIAANPSVALLADRYDADWSRLWWVRADGRARHLTDPAQRDSAATALRAKYRQYADHRLDGVIVAIEVSRWSGWAAGGTRPAPGI